MLKLLLQFYCILLLTLPFTVYAEAKIVNIYAWSNEIPSTVIQQFEKETGIKVNISTYENNEILYAKLRATQQAGYDIVMPSSYFADRMAHLNLLEKLDKAQLSNLKNLDSAFLHPAYDQNLEYTVPFLWGITGLFYNDKIYPIGSIKKWADLWEPHFKNQLALLDDTREIFSMALLSMGYSANDSNPEHIKAAFIKLKALMQNVKVFSTDTLISILIDEDATAGIAWNGDVFKSARENTHVQFVFPEEGFVIWVDNFAIPRTAPHKQAAYAFINFMLRPEIAKAVALYTHFPITNSAGKKLLPPSIQNNPIIYPPARILHRGQFQTDVSDDTLALYGKYWEELKMSG